MASPRHRFHFQPILGPSGLTPIPQPMPCKRCRSINFSDIQLQPPKPIDDFLRAHNVPDSTASALSAIFVKRASQLYDLSLTKLKQLLTSAPCLPDRCAGRIPRLISSPLVTTWFSHYETEIAGWKDDCLAVATRLAAITHGGTIRHRFNQNSTAFLEAYFQSNYFPNTLDRQHIAEMTGNTPKQVEHWFQNHRARAKRAGEKIERSLTAPSFNEVLCSLKKQLPPSVFQGLHQTPNLDTFARPLSPDTTDASDEREPESTSILHISSYFSAPHAFPNKYPPPCSFDPFPSSPVFEVQWERRPTLQASTHCPPALDVDGFIEAFVGKCNVRGTSLKRKRSESADVCRGTWTAATTMMTVPLPAPLPSLIRTVDIQAAQSVSSRPTTPPTLAISSASQRCVRYLSSNTCQREPSKSTLIRHRRKKRRLSSDSDSTPSPPFPSTPTQELVSLPLVRDHDASAQFLVRSHTSQHCRPLDTFKAVSGSFLNYASSTVPFGTPVASIISWG